MSRRDDTVPMRHMLDHTREVVANGYDAVDYDVVWNIATIETPVLIVALERALPGHVT